MAAAATVSVTSTAFAVPAITVAAQTNLVFGQTLSVSGSGFTPGQGLIIVECNGDADIAFVSGTPVAGCDVTDSKGLFSPVNADGSGNLPPTPITLAASNPISSGNPTFGFPSSPKANCPLSGAQRKKGVQCVIAVADAATQQPLATAPIFFKPGGITFSTPPVVGANTLVIKSTKFGVFGSPAGCQGTTGAPPVAPAVACTSFTGEQVLVKVDGATLGLFNAATTGIAQGSVSFNLTPGAHTFTMLGTTTGELAKKKVTV